MNLTKSTLRTTVIASFVVIAIAAALALALLAAVQLWPEAGNASIQWGDYSTAVAGVFERGWFEFAMAWAAITLAILISVAAVLFAFTIGAIALGTVALFMALPLIVIASIIWWMVRRNRRGGHDAVMTHTAPIPHG